MRLSRLAVAVLLISLSSAALPLCAQQAQPDSQRKVVNKVMPMYPPLARTMNVRGAVRLDVLVEPNGSVKTVETKGGHPLLVQAAEGAIKKWKWAPAKEETHENIEIHFNPDN